MSDSSEEKKPSPIQPAGVWSLLVGLVFCAVVVVAVVNTVSGSDGGVLGSKDESGVEVPDFAVADARGPLTGDANLAQTDCETSERPCPADSIQTPACEVEVNGSIVSCELFRKPTVISFWFTRGGECESQQDVFERVYRNFGSRGVNFLAVDVRDDRETVRRLIRQRGWTHPVGLDPDGGLSNLLLVGGCPTFVFVRPGGVIDEVALGDQTVGSLSSQVEVLIASSNSPVEPSGE